MTIPTTLTAIEIANKIAAAIEGDHICTWLYGSRARGDNHPASDLDLVIMCKSINPALLEKIGSVCSTLNADYEINPQVMSELEMYDYPTEMGLSTLHMEGKILVGHANLPAFDVGQCIAKSNSLLGEALMSVRHYIVSQEISALPTHKLQRYILKPLLHGLRFHHFGTERLCQDNGELMQLYSLPGPKETANEPQINANVPQTLEKLCLNTLSANKNIKANINSAI
jgi:hypothetical protein